MERGSALVEIRDATAFDSAFLTDMAIEAFSWRPGVKRMSMARFQNDTELARYTRGWPRVGDCGFIAESAAPVGAAWYRLYPSTEPGFGYLAQDIPELSVAIRRDWRHRGIGRRLLKLLIDAAAKADYCGISLSVEKENPALALYLSLGFSPVRDQDEAWLMLLSPIPSKVT